MIKFHIIVLYLYILIGIYHMIKSKPLPAWYVAFIIYFAFKWITNYRKCTISYIECKLRGVKKEEGYLYNFLNEMTNLRYSQDIIFIFLLIGMMFFYQLYIKGNDIF
jgi:hypothetical protein